MNRSIGHLGKVGVLAFIATIGFDLFLHAGILSPLYSNPDSFLLDSQESFRRIPIGYLSFAIFTSLLLWIMRKINVRGWRKGLVFGLLFGAVVWGSFVLGLFSISRAAPALLLGWFLGQTAESGVAGMVVGSGFAASQLKPLLIKVLVFFIVAITLGITIQNVI